MSKVFGGLLGVGILSGLIFTVAPKAAESEGMIDRDVTVKEEIGIASEKDRTEIGEVEREPDRGSSPVKSDGREMNNRLHDSHDSPARPEHESNFGIHENSVGPHEPPDHP